MSRKINKFLKIYSGDVVRSHLKRDSITVLFENGKIQFFRPVLSIKQSLQKKILPVKLQMRLESDGAWVRNVKEQSIVLNMVFKSFNYNFTLLQEITLCYVTVSQPTHCKLIKLTEHSPVLKELRLEEFGYSESLFVLLLKHLQKKEKRFNIFLFRIYDKDLKQLNENKCLYILSLVATHCLNLFHGQTNKGTLEISEKFFFIAADKIYREKQKTRIYLGNEQSLTKNEMDKFLEEVRIKLYANTW